MGITTNTHEGLKNTTGDLNIINNASDGDVIIKGNDGGSTITALTLDMSDAGAAYFNNRLYIPEYIAHTGDVNTLFGFSTADTFIINTGGTTRLTLNDTTATFAGGVNVGTKIGLPDGGDLFWDGGYGANKPVLAANGTTMKMYPSGASGGVQFSLTPTTATFAGHVTGAAFTGQHFQDTSDSSKLINPAGASTINSLTTTGNITIHGSLVGKSDNTTEVGTFTTGAIKRIRMAQGGELHFGDTTTAAPLGITEGNWNSFADNDFLSIYGRSQIKLYAGALNATLAATLNSSGLTVAGNVTLPGIVLDGNTITGIDDSDEFTDDDSHIMTSAAINDKITSRISGLGGGTGNGDMLLGTAQDITANKEFQDNVKALFGTGGDMSIDFDGTNGQILENAGDLYITNSANDKDILFQTSTGTASAATYITLDGSDAITRVHVPLWISEYIVHIGDTNTYFGFSAADTFVVHAGATGHAELTITGTSATFAGAVSLTGGALSISGDGSNAVTLTESANGDFTINAPDDIRLDAGGGDIVLKDDDTEFGRLTNNAPGLAITSSVANSSINLTPNGTGNVYANTDTLIVSAAEGEAAKFLLRADEGDDNGDDWYITNETSNVLTFKNNISGTSTQLFGITPSSSASSSIATFAGEVEAASLDINGVASIDGDVTITSQGLATSPVLRLNNSASSSFNHALEAINPNLTATETELLLFGKATSARNSGFIGYNWNADNSNTNYVTIGHWGYNHLLKIFPTGNATFAGTITGTTITSTVNSTDGRIRAGVAGQLHLGDDSDIISVGRSNELWSMADVDSDQTLYIHYRGYNNASSRFRSLDIRDGKAGQIALFNGTNKSTTFGGNITASSHGHSFGSSIFKAPDATASIAQQIMCADGANAATFRTTTSGRVFEIKSQNSGTIKIDTTTATFTGHVAITGGNDIFLADNGKTHYGASNDLEVYHDGSNSYVLAKGTGDLILEQQTDDKDIIFKSDNGTGGVDTYFIVDGTQHTIDFFKQTHFYDNVKATFGHGNDLQIYHDGSNSYIDDTGTGRLRFKSSSQIDFLGANGESMVNMIENGGVKLYYNNVKKFETVTAGVKTSYTATSNTDGDAAGDIVYLGETSTTAGRIYYYTSGGAWELTDADAVSTSKGMLGVALGSGSGSSGMLLRGMVTLNHDPGTVGDTLFLSATVGRATSTAPSGSGDIVRIIGYCLDSSNGQVYFNPDGAFVEVA